MKFSAKKIDFSKLSKKKDFSVENFTLKTSKMTKFRTGPTFLNAPYNLVKITTVGSLPDKFSRSLENSS